MLDETSYCEIVFSVTEALLRRASNRKHDIKSGFLQHLSVLENLEEKGLEQAFSHMPIEEKVKFARILGREVSQEEAFMKDIDRRRLTGISAAVRAMKRRKDAESKSIRDFEE